MKKKIFKTVLGIVVGTFVVGCCSIYSQAKTSVSGAPAFRIVAHVQDVGDMEGALNKAGQPGSNLRLEGLSIEHSAYKKDFKYRVFYEDNKSSSWSKNAEFAGTRGEAKAITAVEFEASGRLEKQFDVYIRTHITTTTPGVSLGWTSWCKDAKSGVNANIPGHYIDGFEIAVVKNGEKPKETSKIPEYLAVSNFEVSHWGMDSLNVSQVGGEDYSHKSLLACDVVGSEYFNAPFTCKVTGVNKSYGRISVDSCGPVWLPDGRLSYVSLQILHSTSWKDLRVGEVIVKGQPLAKLGGVGQNGAEHAYAVHAEVRVADYHVPVDKLLDRSAYTSYPFSVFFVNPEWTQVVNEGYAASNRVTSGYLNDYRNRWKYRSNIAIGAEEYNANLLVEKKAPLREGPGEYFDNTAYASAKVGETLQCYAKVTNGYNNVFYLTDKGYVFSGNVKVIENNAPVTVSNLVLPSGEHSFGNIFILNGSLSPNNNETVTIKAVCTNLKTGKVAFAPEMTISATTSLRSSYIDKQSVFNLLEPSAYEFAIYANGILITSSTFTVK